MGNVISGNSCTNEGGGLWIGNGSSPVLIMDNEFIGNESINDAALHCEESSSITITGNLFEENMGIPDANIGAVSIHFTDSCVISDNLITGNYPYGLWFNGVNTACIANNVITDNSPGGGIRLEDVSRARLSNNIIAENTNSLGSGYWGGGIYCGWESLAFLSGNTITGNHSITRGGGIACVQGSVMLITDTILWDNTAPVGPEIMIGAPVAQLGIQYSTVRCGQDSVLVEGGSTLLWGSGMSESDPLFVSAEEGDYHMSCLSPCINGGDPDREPDPDETDVDGEPRVMREIIDMGADEVPYPHNREAVGGR